MINLPAEHAPYEHEMMEAINKVIQQAQFINGESVKKFSTSLANYLNNNTQVIPCGNGTDALQIALMALDLNPGDEVIVPSFNYVSAVEAICLLGLTPVFVDSNLDSFNISYDDVKKKISSKTKAIIAVHLFGDACDLSSLLKISQNHNIPLIEDNAQSFGSEIYINGTWKKLGTIGDIGTTSFFPTKNLGGLGDGGAIFTSNDQFAKKIKAISSHGQSEKYTFDIVGMNSRLDTIQAAALSVKLNFLDTAIAKRQENAFRYLDQLNQVKAITLPAIDKNRKHTFNQFSIQTTQRDRLKEILLGANIPCMIYYPTPLHLQPAYQEYSKGSLPVAEQLSKTVLSLPIHPTLEKEQQDFIIDTIKKVLN